MLNHIFKFDYNINKHKFLLYYEKYKHLSVVDGYAKKGNIGDIWKTIYLKEYNLDCVREIEDFFEIKGDPRFYILKPNEFLPWHMDYNPKCALNFLLSDDNTAPVCFKEGEEIFNYNYKCALLNVKKLHSVKNGINERILFKIEISNEDFDTVKQKIMKKL